MGVGGVEVVAAIVIAAAAAAEAEAAGAATWILAKGLGGRRPVPELRRGRGGAWHRVRGPATAGAAAFGLAGENRQHPANVQTLQRLLAVRNFQRAGGGRCGGPAGPPRPTPFPSPSAFADAGAALGRAPPRRGPALAAWEPGPEPSPAGTTHSGPQGRARAPAAWARTDSRRSGVESAPWHGLLFLAARGGCAGAEARGVSEARNSRRHWKRRGQRPDRGRGVSEARNFRRHGNAGDGGRWGWRPFEGGSPVFKRVLNSPNLNCRGIALSLLSMIGGGSCANRVHAAVPALLWCKTIVANDCIGRESCHGASTPQWTAIVGQCTRSQPKVSRCGVRMCMANTSRAICHTISCFSSHPPWSLSRVDGPWSPREIDG